jgi:hypothetical protein
MHPTLDTLLGLAAGIIAGLLIVAYSRRRSKR